MIMKRLLYDTLVVTMLFVSSTVSAKTINLYSEPKIGSEVASAMNTEDGVTIVYTPKSGEWIKVANPKNGDVGWVKSSDLGGKGYNMRVFTSNNGYSVYHFGTGDNQSNQKQLENAMQHFEQQERMMQIYVAHMFNDMFYFPQPVFVPVVMVPERAKLQKTTSAKAPHKTQASQTPQVNKS